MKTLVRFADWPAVLAYAATGATLYYQAPMDVRPTCLTAAGPGRQLPWTYKVTARPKAIKIKPHRDCGDPFTADHGHLARFLRPADESTDPATPVLIPRDDTFEQIGRQVHAQEGAPRTGWNVREVCIRWAIKSAQQRGHCVGSCGTSLECSRCSDSCAVNPDERAIYGKLAFSQCSRPL